MKKICLFVTLILIILWTSFSFTACSTFDFEFERIITEDKTIEYSVCGVKKWNSRNELSIPSTYFGSPVTKIELIGELPLVTNIEIPHSIKSISAGAFQQTGCYSSSENWKNNALYIGNYLIEVKSSDKTSFVIEDGTKGIANYAFANCTSVEEIVIPDSVKTICEYAFADCKSLKNVHFGTGLTYIGEYAFSECRKLESVVISNRVEELERGAFSGCVNLTSATLNGEFSKIKDFTFSGCKSLISVLLGENIKEIGTGAFFSCVSLETIILSDGLKKLGNGAFSSCQNLKTVVMSKGLEHIGSDVFLNSKVEIFFKGNTDDLVKIENSESLKDKVYFYEENKPLKEGSFWHYSSDGFTPIKW